VSKGVQARTLMQADTLSLSMTALSQIECVPLTYKNTGRRKISAVSLINAWRFVTTGLNFFTR